MKEYYNQTDSRWANHPYTSPTHPQANLKTSGCGPRSAEMKDSNRIIIYDPYLYNGKFNQLGRQGKVEVKGNEVYCSIENFQKYAKCQAYFYYKSQQK